MQSLMIKQKKEKSVMAMTFGVLHFIWVIGMSYYQEGHIKKYVEVVKCQNNSQQNQ
jgi:hypothetical protein